jgi:1,2-diacylglycerol 3-beta-galactosyltransferase
LPLIIYSFIPGQEEGNVRYVVEHGAGAYVPDLAEIPVLLQEWFQSDNDTLRQMAVNVGALGRPEATLIIARRVHRLLTEKEVCHTIPPGVALA